MLRRFYIFSFLSILAATAHIYAANTQDSTIVSHIQKESAGRVMIIMPSGLMERLVPRGEVSTGESEDKTSGSRTAVGYRVQVFTDNNHRTARNEAQIKERNIEARFPKEKTYLSYKAPAWRLRVGDFRTHEEAADFLRQIKAVFPGYAREATIVRDRINIY